MYEVDIVEAKEKLLELIEAAMRGEEVAITQDNQPVVKLVGIPKQAKPNRKAGSAKGMVWMSDDFDYGGYGIRDNYWRFCDAV
ncbi:MAG: type II toxin-antitoxin system prevent-host-death family antitoxin [Microcoleus sp. PH2017_11_PCY_U_A]|uniref:type II toxin-antitoxin system Phd/YefM family antitoxin n=1 Tax=Microcoleus sp. PH2017_11_PCY_U_A TaxID=2798822 RepID=UPI001D4D72E9|nr:type II toxin-antitoxin system prevent-host-death family antitoxin [Microcoleus sp. PH2017_11_PCY_U_A]MCC3459989.1 type II toxin-antitoxin system prevent-host-death family antitoxin [Microcoleus sp. PH2017_11_PCY_U_A]TAF34318.1 MAG: type II toxin-antitoxin system prevent-host-death family antitoxin [Oscillatoriales cyanobacterium]